MLQSPNPHFSCISPIQFLAKRFHGGGPARSPWMYMAGGTAGSPRMGIMLTGQLNILKSNANTIQ